MQACSVCAQAFASRNLLFKHIRLGGGQCPSITGAVAVEGNALALAATVAGVESPLPAPLVINKDLSSIEWPSTAGPGSKRYLYVTGGRIRGRTLSCVERYVFGENRWENCPNMTEARGSHGSAAANGRVYVFGGGGLHSNLSACESFDGEKWSYIAPCSDVRHALAVTSSGNYAYVVGGWRDGSKCSATVERYDTSLDEWTTLPPMQLARRLLASCVHGNHLYVFGGNCEDPHWFTNKAERLDMESGTWEYISDVPDSGEMSAQSVGDSIFVLVHGRCVYTYIEATNEYKHAVDLPIPKWFCFGTATFGKYLLAFGGIVDGRWCKEAFALDTDTMQWTQLAHMNHCRRRCAGSVVSMETSMH